MMDDKRLRGIEARIKAATPGPWEVDYSLISAPKSFEQGNKRQSYRDGKRSVMVPQADMVATTCVDEYIPNPRGDANATLIAHAPEDLRDLLAEVKRMRGEIGENNERDTFSIKVLQFGVDYMKPVYDAAMDYEKADRDVGVCVNSMDRNEFITPLAVAYETLIAACRKARESQ